MSMTRSSSKQSMPPLVPGYTSPSLSRRTGSGAQSSSRSHSRSKTPAAETTIHDSPDEDEDQEVMPPPQNQQIPQISITQPKSVTSLPLKAGSQSGAESARAARALPASQMDPLAAHFEDIATGNSSSLARSRQPSHTPDGTSDEEDGAGEAAIDEGLGAGGRTLPTLSPDRAARSDGGVGSPSKLKHKRSFFRRFRKDKKTDLNPNSSLDSSFSIGDLDDDGDGPGDGLQRGHRATRVPVKIKLNRKPRRDFDHLARVQVLGGDTMGFDSDVDKSTDTGLMFTANDVDAEIKGPVWALRWSKCGRYLAAAGQDGILRIWKLTNAQPDAHQEPRMQRSHSDDISRATSAESSEAVSPDTSLNELHSTGHSDADLSASFHPSRGGSYSSQDAQFHPPRGGSYSSQGASGQETPLYSTNASSPTIFESRPYRVFKGHTAAILDVTWSRNGFIASASMDKTVRIWHVDRAICLCSLTHKGCVTSARFHPTDDRYILTGALDSRVRIWSIEEKRVMAWNETPNGSYVTAVAFTRDAAMCAAGTFTGELIFYETDGLRYNTQIEVKSTKDRHSKKKITGIEPLPYPWGGEERLLVTSNDSRVRMYNIRDKSLHRKYKGLECRASQIKATFSEDGRFLIAGSEDRQVYIWNLYPPGLYGGAPGLAHTAATNSGSNATDGDPESGPGLLSGLMHWQADASRSSSWERFPGSSEAVTCSVFSPKATRDLLQPDGYSDLPRFGEPGSGPDALSELQDYSTEGVVIAIADMLGRIRIFENRNVTVLGPIGDIHGTDHSSEPCSTTASPVPTSTDDATFDSRSIDGSRASLLANRRQPAAPYKNLPGLASNGMRRSASDLTGTVPHHLQSQVPSPSPRPMTPPVARPHSYHATQYQASQQAQHYNLPHLPSAPSSLHISTDMPETHFPARTATPRTTDPNGSDPSSSSLSSPNTHQHEQQTMSPHLEAIIADMSVKAAQSQAARLLAASTTHSSFSGHRSPTTALSPEVMRRSRSATYTTGNAEGSLPQLATSGDRHVREHGASDVPPLRALSRDFLHLPKPLSKRHLKEGSIEEEG